MANMLRKYLTWTFVLVFLLLSLSLTQEKTSAQESGATAAEVIQAVNQLRIENGLLPLNTHPVLMEVAEWEANAIAGGAPGHTRPNGLTLGQWLLSLGYPLSGDLSMDGYRSENWVAASSAQAAIEIWLMDGPHTNTMLSPDRSDIGAAIAVSDQTYIVLETALQTRSGEMQSEAYPMLTAIASSSGGVDSSVPQYIIPVMRSTARPDGNVTHKVQYGQSLWSIAVTYNTTIAQIRAWNNLGDTTEIYEGQVLLVQMGATQPPPATNTPKATITPFSTSTPTDAVASPTVTIGPTSTIEVQNEGPVENTSSPGMWVGTILVFALVAGIFGSRLFTRST